MLLAVVFPMPEMFRVEAVFSPLSVPAASLPPTDIPTVLFSSWPVSGFYPLPCSFVFAFSCGEFVLPAFGSFPGLFTAMWLYSWDEVRLGSSYSTIVPRSLKKYFETIFLYVALEIVRLQVPPLMYHRLWFLKNHHE